MECGALAPLSARDFSPRRKAMDDPALKSGPDKHVPPQNGPDKQVPPKRVIGGARLSCPGKPNGGSNVDNRTRQAGPSGINGPDKQVPPRGRRGTLVVPGDGEWGINRWFIRPDKHVPPRGGPDKRVPPKEDLTSTSLRNTGLSFPKARSTERSSTRAHTVCSACQVMPLLGMATTLKGALFHIATGATIGRTPHGTTPR